MESIFSNQVEEAVPNGAPAAPFIKTVEFKNGEAHVTVALPIQDASGGPLTGLKNCYVFFKESSFEGSTPEQERAAGTINVVTPILPDMAGNAVTLVIPGLQYDKEYYFVASCDD